MEDIKESAFDKLSDKHKSFVLEYIIDFNATKSYQRVYQCAYDTARSCGQRLLTNDDIKAALDEKLQEIWDNREKERGRILEELKPIAFLNPNDVVEWDGNKAKIRSFDDIDPRAVSSIKIKNIKSESKKSGEDVSEVVEIKFWDKNKALSEMAKLTGAVVEKHEIESKTFAEWVKSVADARKSD